MNTDFRIKGFHIDLRIQVMPMAALRKFAAELAGFGLNTLLVEWEATFPYEKHAVISNEYAYTRKEVESFVSYCTGLGIEVIPLQQCFGHLEYILRHERYAHLRESNKDICQLCPLKKKRRTRFSVNCWRTWLPCTLQSTFTSVAMKPTCSATASNAAPRPNARGNQDCTSTTSRKLPAPL